MFAACGYGFSVELLASGLTSASVGSYAGSHVMTGLLGFRVSPTLRSRSPLVPAVGILALGAHPTAAVVLSQAFVSLRIPFALVALLRAIRSMGVSEHRAGPSSVRRCRRRALW